MCFFLARGPIPNFVLVDLVGEVEIPEFVNSLHPNFRFPPTKIKSIDYPQVSSLDSLSVHSFL